MGEFRDKLREAVNECNRENGSDTPDWILAQYLEGCLDVFDKTVRQRSKWYGHHDSPLGQEEVKQDD